MTFGSAYIGEQKQIHRAGLVPGSNRRVRFDGRRRLTIPAGREALSDPVRISFQALDHLAVSVYVKAPGGPATEHWPIPGLTSFASAPGSGDLAAQEQATGFSSAIDSWPFITGIETRLPRRDGVLVAVGDAVTQGLVSSPIGGSDKRYTNFLARRLDARPHGAGLSVLNEGIGGNFLQRDAILPWNGPSLLSRLRADVLARPGLTDVILLSGLVDLGVPPYASAQDVISGLQRAVHQMKRFRGGGRRHLNVLVGTLTPTGRANPGPLFPTLETNPKRNEVNRYIRHSGIGDGYVDFARALRDPDHPAQLLPRYDSGDQVHPSSAGLRRMAQAVPLSELKGTGCR
jgi:lysophospholipase L1-like esterase